MRLKVTISFDKNGLALPMNYQQILQGFIYRQLDSDLEFCAFLHENGYKYEKGVLKHLLLAGFLEKRNITKKVNKLSFTDQLLGTLVQQSLSLFNFSGSLCF